MSLFFSWLAGLRAGVAGREERGGERGAHGLVEDDVRDPQLLSVLRQKPSLGVKYLLLLYVFINLKTINLFVYLFFIVLC